MLLTRILVAEWSRLPHASRSQDSRSYAILVSLLFSRAPLSSSSLTTALAFTHRTDPNGASAITSMLAIVAKLLQQNDDSESGGLAVGDLLIALLRKAPQAILSVLPDLLTALANRLVNVKTATFAQVSYGSAEEEECELDY